MKIEMVLFTALQSAQSIHLFDVSSPRLLITKFFFQIVSHIQFGQSVACVIELVQNNISGISVNKLILFAKHRSNDFSLHFIFFFFFLYSFYEWNWNGERFQNHEVFIQYFFVVFSFSFTLIFVTAVRCQ